MKEQYGEMIPDQVDHSPLLRYMKELRERLEDQGVMIPDYGVKLYGLDAKAYAQGSLPDGNFVRLEATIGEDGEIVVSGGYEDLEHEREVQEADKEIASGVRSGIAGVANDIEPTVVGAAE